MPRIFAYTALGAVGLAAAPGPAAADGLIVSPGLLFAADTRGPEGRTALGVEVTGNALVDSGLTGFGLLFQLEFDFDGGVRALVGGQGFAYGLGLEAGVGWYRPPEGPPTTEVQLAPFAGIGFVNLAGRLVLHADGPDAGVALTLKYPLISDGALPLPGGCGAAEPGDEAVCGRPLRGSEGRPWRAPVVAGGPPPRSPLTEAADAVEPDARRRLAAAWLADACDEHAAIGAFCQLAWHLAAHGAPRSLIDGARRASRDEVEHARRAFRIASALAGRTLRPAPTPPPWRPVPSLAEMAIEGWLDGAMNEGRAAAEAVVALRSASVPPVRALLGAIAREEARHAELGAAVAEWAAGRDVDAWRALCEARTRRATFDEPRPAASPLERAWGRVERATGYAVGSRA